MEKYKVEKTIGALPTCDVEVYVIVKRERFLFWTYWTQNYLYKKPNCFYSTDESKAKILCDRLNNKKYKYDYFATTKI